MKTGCGGEMFLQQAWLKTTTVEGENFHHRGSQDARW